MEVLEALELPEVYTGRIKDTNMKALYSINDTKKSCKRVTPISFEYIIPDIEELNAQMIAGNLSMLDKLLSKKNMRGKVNYHTNTITVGSLLFSSTDEGIAVIDKTTMKRETLKSSGEIEEFISNHKTKKSEIAQAKRQKSKRQLEVNYVREKELFDKFKHLLPT